MYKDRLIPFKYIDKRNPISITPRREDFRITGNESFWKEKEKRDGRVYRTAR
ncbi:MAG: hypothetical protein Q4A21_01150 [bacterium]|nr:hypothetical protein [bacterium]